MRVDKSGTRAVQAALVLFGLATIVSCSSKALSVMFDVPPPEPEPEVAEAPIDTAPARPPASNPAAAFWEDPNAERPPIEAVTGWEQALALLPQDKKGKPDWAAAVRDGIVKPRALEAEDLGAKAFRMDFFLRNEKKPKFDAWFPHSAHTEWLGCDNCHGTVFRYKSNEMTMKAMRKGEYCGACHNEIAFSMKECARCHPAMKK